MQRFTKAMAAIILMMTVVCAVGCKSKNVSSGVTDAHEYVDLGLPSGTLWATCNVGTSKPKGYGNYYAWGETQTKDTYQWETYKYGADGDWFELTKYCNNSEFGNNGFTDNLTILQTSDDPATANWGNGWHTPTMEQWEELLDNTTNQWTTKNGVEGRLFTAKNGKTLFLPAAGYRWNGELYDVASRGNYWSRSLDTDSPYEAWSLYFYSDVCGMYHYVREGGFSVRPVREK